MLTRLHQKWKICDRWFNIVLTGVEVVGIVGWAVTAAFLELNKNVMKAAGPLHLATQWTTWFICESSRDLRGLYAAVICLVLYALFHVFSTSMYKTLREVSVKHWHTGVFGSVLPIWVFLSLAGILSACATFTLNISTLKDKDTLQGQANATSSSQWTSAWVCWVAIREKRLILVFLSYNFFISLISTGMYLTLWIIQGNKPLLFTNKDLEKGVLYEDDHVEVKRKNRFRFERKIIEQIRDMFQSETEVNHPQLPQYHSTLLRRLKEYFTPLVRVNECGSFRNPSLVTFFEAKNEFSTAFSSTHVPIRPRELYVRDNGEQKTCKIIRYPEVFAIRVRDPNDLYQAFIPSTIDLSRIIHPRLGRPDTHPRPPVFSRRKKRVEKVFKRLARGTRTVEDLAEFYGVDDLDDFTYKQQLRSTIMTAHVIKTSDGRFIAYKPSKKKWYVIEIDRYDMWTRLKTMWYDTKWSSSDRLERHLTKHKVTVDYIVYVEAGLSTSTQRYKLDPEREYSAESAVSEEISEDENQPQEQNQDGQED